MKRFFFFLASFLYATIFTFGQCDHNLLLNSDFESSIRAGDNWVPTAQADISNDARSGQQAMKIDASPFVRIWQVFPATPGQEYTFSGYLKTTGAGSGIAISFLTADYQPNFEFLEFEPSNTYNKIELTRTALANTAWIQVLFIASPDAPLFADDFCLVEGDGSSSNCTISATVSNLFCNDAGTSEDPSDDEYGFDLEVSSTNGGPTFDFIVPSLNINIPRTYGTLPVNGNKISDGIKTIILRDSSVPNCETTINVTPPATCSNGSGSGCGFNRSYTQLGNNPLKRLSASENIDGNFTIRVSEPTAGNDLNTLYYDISNSGDFIQRTSISSIPRNGIFFPDGGYYQAPFNVGTGLQLNIFDETNTQIAQGVVPVNPAVQSLQGFVSLRKIDGGYLGSMVVNQSNPTEFYLYAFEVDEQLNLKWSRLFPNQVSGAYSFRPLLLASDGGRYFLSNDSNFYSVFKLDNQGNELWNQGNFASAAIVFEGISESPNGQHIYTTDMGAALRGTGNFVNYFKYDATTGQEIWSVGAPSNRISDSGILGLDNGAITTYVVDSETFYRLHNENGDVVWERSIPGVHSVQEQTVDGGFLFVGINGASQAQLIKTTSNGELNPTCQMTSGQAELTIIGEPCPTNFPQKGGTVSVDFTIKNTGGTASSGETIYLYRSVTCRACGPANLGSVSVPPLQPNEEVTLTVTGENDRDIPESYVSTGQAVPTTYFGYFLSNERSQFPRNLKDIDYYCKKFDSDISIEIDPITPEYNASGEITFRLTARNLGNQDAKNVAVYFLEDVSFFSVFIDNVITGTNADLESTNSGAQWVIPNISAGAEVTSNFTFKILNTPQYATVPDDLTITANISSGHNLNTNTANDSDSFTFMKMGGPPAAGDLVLIATGDSNIPQWSDGVAYFEITNRSGETFDNIQVRFDFDQNIRLMGGNQYTSSAGTTLEQSWTRNPVWNVGTMGAGEVKHIALNVYSITNSPMEIYAQISQATGQDVTSTPGNGTPFQPNEDDEVLWKINDSQTGNLPDLLINTVSSMGGQSLEPGTVWNYVLDVANEGNASVSGDFTIKTYFSADNILSPDDIQDGTIVTGNFGANTMINDIPGASIIPASLQPGDYYMIVKIDADEVVVESDEGNNIIFTPFSIQNETTSTFHHCEKIIDQDVRFISCIESIAGTNNIRIKYNGVKEVVINDDLGILSSNTLSPQENFYFEFNGSSISKFSADSSMIYTRMLPQTLTSRLTINPSVIELQSGFAFFGWEDSNPTDTLDIGDTFWAIRTDVNFNTVVERVLSAQGATSVSGNYYNFITFGDNFFAYVSRSRGGFLFENINVTDENFQSIGSAPTVSFAFTGSTSISKNSCGDINYRYSETNLCSGFCASTKYGEIKISGDTITQFLYSNERYNEISFSGERRLFYGWGAVGEVNGNIDGGGSRDVRDSDSIYLQFAKQIPGLATIWRKSNVIPNSSKIQRIYELNNKLLIFKIVDGNLLVSDFDCYDPPPTPQGIDLTLAFRPMTNSNPSQWSYFPVSLQVANRGTETANDVTVKFNRADEVVYHGGNEYTASQGDFQHWGDEIWRVGDLAAGQSATITINYYRISANGFTAFAEVESMSGTDINSTPGNGTCCTANEDDEAVLQIRNSAQGINNRSAIAENLGNEVFAIVGANPNPTTGRFNIEVYSNENQISEMTIVDILGRPIFRKEVNLNEGHNSIPIELDSGNAGMLVVKMTPFHPYLRQVRVMKIRD